MSMKNPLTQAGIERATFRFVAQHLNHCVTAVSYVYVCVCVYIYIFIERERARERETVTMTVTYD